MSWRFETRTPRGGAMRWWLGAAGLVAGAAAAAYWLDPKHGDERRARTAERVTTLARTLWSSGERRARRVTLRAASRMRAPFPSVAAGADSWPQEAPPDVDSEPEVVVPARRQR